MIKQQLPTHLYVDIDEVQNLKAFGGPDVSFTQALSILYRGVPKKEVYSPLSRCCFPLLCYARKYKHLVNIFL